MSHPLMDIIDAFTRPEPPEEKQRREEKHKAFTRGMWTGALVGGLLGHPLWVVIRDVAVWVCR